MAINPMGTLPPELFEQQQQLNRQQKMAQLLMQQGQQMPQGQMVSGRFVPPSFFQNITPLVQSYLGARMAEKGDKQALDLAAQLRQRYGDELKEFRSLMQGKEELAPEQAGPTQTGQAIPQEMVRGAPNLQGAYDFAASAYNPVLQQIGVKKLTEGPESFTLTEGAKRFVTMPDGSVREVAAGGEKQSPEYRNYLIAKNDPINPFKGGFTDYQTMIKKAGATNINMPSEGERKAGFMANILDKNIAQMQTALGVDPTAVKPNVPASIVSAIAGENVLSRAITPAQRQIIEDSQLDVLDAALTLRTGAAYTREQLLGMRGTYFPRIGDSPETVKAKQGRLETLLSSAYIASGRATPDRVSATPPAPTPKPPAPSAKLPPAPAGVDQRTWNAMTPQERALFK
jgi:hypothetical protein